MSGLPGRLLPHTATIERKSDAPAGGGGFPVVWSVVVASVSCRFEQGRPAETVHGDIEQADVLGHAYFADGTDIQRDDRVTVDGVVSSVYGIREPSVRGFYRKAILREVQSGVVGGVAG